MTYAWLAFGIGVVLVVVAIATESAMILVAGSVTVLGAFGHAVFISQQDEREAWALFAAEHSCRVVGKQSGTTSIMILPNATSGTTLIPITSPGKTGYACDDGVTYWR